MAMAFDIFGQRLLPGHCEVHPHIHDEYPCCMCLAHDRQRAQECDHEGPIEDEYLTHICETNNHPAELIDPRTGRCFCGAVQSPRSGWPPTEKELTA